MNTNAAAQSTSTRSKRKENRQAKLRDIALIFVDSLYQRLTSPTPTAKVHFHYYQSRRKADQLRMSVCVLSRLVCMHRWLLDVCIQLDTAPQQAVINTGGIHQCDIYQMYCIVLCTVFGVHSIASLIKSAVCSFSHSVLCTLHM